ncbi:MAG: hypothetical protein Q9167_002582 [Letrouitia subvulpina]
MWQKAGSSVGPGTLRLYAGLAPTDLSGLGWFEVRAPIDALDAWWHPRPIYISTHLMLGQMDLALLDHPVRPFPSLTRPFALQWHHLVNVPAMPVIGGSQAGLLCSYDAIPQKKGPKGSRAKVISELRLREVQKQAEHRRNDSTHNYRSPASSPSSPRSEGLLTLELINGCMDFFFAQMYPTMPIMHKEQIWKLVADMDTSVEAYCLLSSFAAFMLIQPGIEMKAGQTLKNLASANPNVFLGTAFLDDALRRRKRYDYIEKPSVNAVITSFFLFGCCFGLNKHNTAWYHLREATTLAQIIGMQDESTYATGDPVDVTSRRRLFWLLFVTERAYALQKHRPLTLHATIGLPTAQGDSSNTLTGFIHLVNVYRPFDDSFVGLWNKSRQDCSTLWLAHLQKQLTDALPTHLEVTETQEADLRTSQHWLRTMVWQLSITNGYLSSTSPDSSMTFGYPIEIAKDLVTDTSRLSQRSMEVHGIGLIEKIFDVACTLVDVMSCVPIESRNSELGSQDYLNHLIRLISTLRGGDSRYLPLIMTKIQDTVPSVAATLNQPLPNIKIEQNGEDLQDSTASSNSSRYQTLTNKNGTPVRFGLGQGLTRRCSKSNLSNAASLLWHLYRSQPAPLNAVNWAGFYTLAPAPAAGHVSIKQDEQQRPLLLLGPFMGKPACQRIAVGKGVCGTAAAEKRVVRVGDVDVFPGHIACDGGSRSEIVVPVVVEGEKENE